MPQTLAVPARQTTLERTAGPFLATCLIVANVIGSGIYTTPGFLARDLGSPVAVLAIWIVGAVLAFAGALSYSELGTMFPEAGGEYVYLREAFGPLWGFMTGWASFFVGFSAPIAAASIGFCAYSSHFFQWLECGGLHSGRNAASTENAAAFSVRGHCDSQRALCRPEYAFYLRFGH